MHVRDIPPEIEDSIGDLVGSVIDLHNQRYRVATTKGSRREQLSREVERLEATVWRKRHKVISTIGKLAEDVDEPDARAELYRTLKRELQRRSLAGLGEMAPVITFLNTGLENLEPPEGKVVLDPIKWRGSLPQLSVLLAAIYRNYVDVHEDHTGREFDSPPSSLRQFVLAISAILEIEKVDANGKTRSFELKYRSLNAIKNKKGARIDRVVEEVERGIGKAGAEVPDELDVYASICEMLVEEVKGAGDTIPDDFGIDSPL